MVKKKKGMKNAQQQQSWRKHKLKPQKGNRNPGIENGQVFKNWLHQGGRATGTPHTAGGHPKWESHKDNSLVVSYIHLPYNLGIPLLGLHLLERTENRCPYIHLYDNVYSRFSHIIKNWEQPKGPSMGELILLKLSG